VRLYTYRYTWIRCWTGDHWTPAQLGDKSASEAFCTWQTQRLTATWPRLLGVMVGWCLRRHELVNSARRISRTCSNTPLNTWLIARSTASAMEIFSTTATF